MRLRAMILGGLVLVAATAVGLAGRAGAARTALPTLNIALSGAKGVSVSGSMRSGAVSVTSTFSGKLPRRSMGADFGLVQLRPGVTLAEAERAGQQSNDLNALTPYASIVVDAPAPGTVQTVLTPGTWVALNLTGNGQPGVMPFRVTKSSSPAALPAATATETAIEFGFRGPTSLHNGTLIRVQNHGYLVHMITLNGAGNLSLADARELMGLLRAGKDRQARKFANTGFELLGPASPGALQQQVLNAKPGYYVEACFMDTQDHREHTQIGMLRVVRVV
jgi:hypothetical protein